MTTVDIVILSNAKDNHYKNITKKCIESLIESEKSEEINFCIVVVETNKITEPYKFHNTITIFPEEEFGYHKYLNIGIKATKSPYVCLCNNDLIFHQGWATEILRLMNLNSNIDSVNPFCDLFHSKLPFDYSKDFIEATKKNIFEGILTGWCIFTKRTLFAKIGLLDEQFVFWYADRDYGMTLLKNNVRHVLANKSKVTHLANISHSLMKNDIFDFYTREQQLVFFKKWHIIKFWYFKLRNIIKLN